jgi:hypothetical protein
MAELHDEVARLLRSPAPVRVGGTGDPSRRQRDEEEDVDSLEERGLDGYTAYMRETGVAGYARTAGNRGVWMLRRDVGDRAEFVMFTLWDSIDAVKGFAGDDYETAVFYPEDDRFLVDRAARPYSTSTNGRTWIQRCSRLGRSHTNCTLSTCVVGKVNTARTQNGHIRNDTRDVLRRMSTACNSPICRRKCVADDRARTRVTPGNLNGKECHEEGPPRSDAPCVLDRRREARCNVVRRFGSQSQASRLSPAQR